MTEQKSRDQQKIELLHKLLKERFEKTSGESVYFSFTELSHEPLLVDRAGLEKILTEIKSASKNKVTFEIRTERRPMPMRAGDYGVYPTLSDPFSVGFDIHISDPSKLDQYFISITNCPVHLSEHPIRFDYQTATLTVADRKCSLPPYLNEHYFCSVIFKEPVNIPIDWSIVYKEMQGVDLMEIKDNKKETEAQTRAVRDTMYAINDRIKKDFNTEDELFSWNKKNVTRNF